MNAIDLIVCLVLVVAVFNGWRQGFILQICSLAGLVAGIWLASRFGAEVGAWLHLDASMAALGGFVAILVVVILVVAVAARLVRKLFHFAGFGLPDIVLGIVVSIAKSLLLLSVLFAAFDSLNRDHSLVEEPTIAKSKSYKPIIRLSESLFPFFEWMGDRVPLRDEKPKNA